MNQFHKTFIFVGLILISIGLLWPIISRIGLGHLPGDIIIRKKNFNFYFPILTSVLISLLISVLSWFFRQ
ncbi:DUF2905 domain-containing protein [Coxiella endosymbiont of Dermacentor marginatus]|uniref:DUF2905 domain-containing protein n=1 Tax=Coxiella endosymbiont of Dermacentor marginatus TaxID=1656159 RepID=UPI002221D2AE|nr:DUF2905 domain-containing protein [Coxiella endosymbiont of Dermacentor marginatus]